MILEIMCNKGSSELVVASDSLSGDKNKSSSAGAFGMRALLDMKEDVATVCPWLAEVMASALEQPEPRSIDEVCAGWQKGATVRSAPSSAKWAGSVPAEVPLARTSRNERASSFIKQKLYTKHDNFYRSHGRLHIYMPSADVVTAESTVGGLGLTLGFARGSWQILESGARR